MSRTHEIREIIAAQRDRGAVSIEDFIRVRARNNSEAEIEESIAFCRELIDGVPVVIDQVRKVAAERGFTNWIEPLVAHAEEYFLDAEDFLPEQQFGEFGLLDDAYVAMKVVSLVQGGPDPILKVDLDGPVSFLQQVLGDEIIEKLDEVVAQAQTRMHARMKELQEASTRYADAERARERDRRGAHAAPVSAVPARPSPAVERPQCGACAGSGSVTCSSCYGQGSHTQSYTRVDWEGNTEYVTEQIPCGCSGGSSICGSCGGSGWL